jgi:hypothetical protein
MSSKVHQTVIIDYLKQGFWIQVTTEMYGNGDVDRCLTNGNDDVMMVKSRTIESMLAKGLIEKQDYRSPTILLEIERYKLRV